MLSDETAPTFVVTAVVAIFKLQNIVLLLGHLDARSPLILVRS